MIQILLLIAVILVVILAISTSGGDSVDTSARASVDSSRGDDRQAFSSTSGRRADQRRPRKDAAATSEADVADLRERLEDATDEQRWSDAIDIVENLTSAVADTESRANLAYRAGTMARDHLDQSEGAVSWFDAALDHDPMKLEAFEAIDRLLTELEEWKELERAHRRQLGRIVEQVDRPATELKAKLWKSLGHIYAERLDHPGSAREALHIANEISDDPEIDEMLDSLDG